MKVTAVTTPTISLSVASGSTFNAASKQITLTASNIAAANTAWYSLNGGTTKTYFSAGNSTKTVNLTMTNNTAGSQQFTITYSADGSTTKTATYTLSGLNDNGWYLHGQFIDDNYSGVTLNRQGTSSIWSVELTSSNLKNSTSPITFGLRYGTSNTSGTWYWGETTTQYTFDATHTSKHLVAESGSNGVNMKLAHSDDKTYLVTLNTVTLMLTIQEQSSARVVFDPANGVLEGPTATVSVSAEDATSATLSVTGGAYKLNGTASATALNVPGANTLSLGPVTEDTNYTVSWSAVGESGTKTGSTTFSVKLPQTFHFYYVDTRGWGKDNINLYTWSGDPKFQDSNSSGYTVTKVDGYTNMYEVSWTGNTAPTEFIVHKRSNLSSDNQTGNLTFVNGNYYAYDSTGTGSTTVPSSATLDPVVYLMGLDRDWTDGIMQMPNDDNQATFTINSWTAGTEFKIRIGSTWYGKGTADIVNKQWYDYPSTAGGAPNFTLPSDATGKKVTIVVASDNGHFKVSWATVANPSPEVAYPGGGKPQQGVVFNEDGSATFCLLAPDKDKVSIAGSWNNYGSQTLMNYQDYNGYRYFWIKVPGVNKTSWYTYYYTVDDTYRVSDPYSPVILDPEYDAEINSGAFADRPAYPTSLASLKSYPDSEKASKGSNGGTPSQKVRVSAVRGDIHDYTWTSSSYTTPDFRGNLNIYELHVGDFNGTNGQRNGEGSFAKAQAKLPYLKDLGVNVIELMPVMEFDMNHNWGYDTNSHFAVDKQYGSPTDLKAFIDACHGQGIAVVLDMVFNHVSDNNPWKLMYAPGTSPFFNTTAPHAWSVHNDFNQNYAPVEPYYNDVLTYWLTNYKVDGFRFDLVKGLGNNEGYDNDNYYGNNQNPTLVARMKRLHAHMKTINPNVLHINEAFINYEDECALNEDGQMVWLHQCEQAQKYVKGDHSVSGYGNLNLTTAENNGRGSFGTINYAESHDEPWLGYLAKTSANTNVSGSLTSRMNRLGSYAAQMFMTHGPKMVWQFCELGYDIEALASGGYDRIGPKEVHWEFLESPERVELHDTYRAMMTLRNENPDLYAASVHPQFHYYNSDEHSRAIQMTAGNKELILFVNPSTHAEAVTLSKASKLAAGNYYVVRATPGYTPDVQFGSFDGWAQVKVANVPANGYCLLATNDVAFSLKGESTEVSTTVRLMGVDEDWETGITTTEVVDNCATITVNNWNSSDEFKVKVNGTWYGTNGTNVATLDNGVWYTTNSAGSAPNMQLPAAANGQTVTFTIAVDNGNVKASWKVPANMPLTSADFKNADNSPKAHYFLVGPRMGDWRLQPEWEFTVSEDGSLSIDGGRFMYPTIFAIAKVDNYNDYAYQRYTFYGGKYWFTSAAIENGKIVCNAVGDKTLVNFQGHSSNTEAVNMYRASNSEGEYNDTHAAFWFCYDADKAGLTDDDLNAHVSNDSGTWVDKITIGLSEGNPSSLTMTFLKDEEDNVVTENPSERIFQLCGSFTSHNDFKNSKKDVTKHRNLYAGLDDWQEGYIQYDPDGKPYYDANGVYLYQTVFQESWFENHPTYFKQQRGSNELTFRSDNVTFVEASRLDDLEEDPYRDFYLSRGTDKGVVNESAAEARKGGSGETAYNYNTNVVKTGTAARSNAENLLGDYPGVILDKGTWTCYVVKDVWMKGQFKIWTGGGGNCAKHEGLGDNSATNMRWNGANGGPLGNGPVQAGQTGVRYEVTGSDVLNASETPVVSNLYRNAYNVNDCNYKTPDEDWAYYNRVILWYNDEAGFENSFVQFIQEAAGPAITATDATEGSTKQIRWEWNIPAPDANTGNVVSYKIYRYRVTNEGEKLDQEFAAVDGNWAPSELHSGVDNHGVGAGTYRYKVAVTYADNTVKAAQSNLVTLYDANNTVQPEPLSIQLLELDNEKLAEILPLLGITSPIGDYASMTDMINDLKTTKTYLTYRRMSDADYYVLNPAENVTTDKAVTMRKINAAAAKAFIKNNRDLYNWSSNFYVRALNLVDFDARMDSYRDQGLIVQTEAVTPIVNITVDGTHYNDIPLDNMLNDPSKQLYGFIYNNNGSLAPTELTVDLSYTVDGNARSASKGSTLTPVAPMPWIAGYTYETVRNTLGRDEDYVFTTGSSIPGHGDDENEVTFKGEDYSLRDLNCKFSMMRPNITDDIIKYYDIIYEVRLTNDDKNLELEHTGYFVDKRETVQGYESYDFYVNNVHYGEDVNPMIEILGVTYKPNSKNSDKSYSLKGTYVNGDVKKVGENVHLASEPQVAFNLQKVNVNGATTDWRINGHTEGSITDPGSEIADGVTIGETIMYHLEAYYKSGADKGQDDHYYSHPVLIAHDPVNCQATDKYGRHPLDNFREIICGEGYPNTQIVDAQNYADRPTIYVTPIYFFKRDPQMDATRDDRITECDANGNTVQRAPRREPAQAAPMAPGSVNIDGNEVQIVRASLPGVYAPGAPGGGTTEIEGIYNDGTSDAVEYYNIQGIRIDNPRAGEIYLVRRGNTVSKELVK